MPVTRTIVLAAIALAGAPAAALAQAPPGPPGPPPGNGTDLPAPPGTAPAFVAPGTAATIPGGATGPGLLKSGDAALNRAKRTFSLHVRVPGQRQHPHHRVRAPSPARATAAPAAARPRS